MILRIRLPSGATERVTLSDSQGLTDLGGKINELNKLEGQFSLFSDPRFANPFVFEQAKHGDFVYIKGAMKTVASSSKTTGKTTTATTDDDKNTISTNGTDETEEKKPSTDPRCRRRHGPRGMCEFCAPKEDRRARAEAELKKMHGKGSSIAVLEALEALKFKISPQEEAHASAAAINNEAANSFQAYLGDTGYSHQRIGFCFGNTELAKDDEDKDEEKKKESQQQKQKTLSSTISEESTPKIITNVHTIYEPPQTGDADTYSLVEDEDEQQAGDITKRAHTISKLLNLQHVGLVISARPRKCMLSAKDIVFSCRVLSKLSEENRKSFIVFVVSSTENNEIIFEAYQISNLAIEMYEADIFEDISKQKPNGGRVLCKEDVLIEGKDTRKVPTEFFMLNIPIKSCESWLKTSFPVENRDIAPQHPAQMKSIMNDSSIPFQKRLADFHLLLFLSNVFDMKHDMPQICKAVKQNEQVEEGYRLMIENMAST